MEFKIPRLFSITRSSRFRAISEKIGRTDLLENRDAMGTDAVGHKYTKSESLGCDCVWGDDGGCSVGG